MKAPKSYEEGMERLNAILAKMQDEQTTLAEAVKLYAEAASLMEYCHTALEKTSLQIEEIDAQGRVQPLQVPLPRGPRAPWVQPQAQQRVPA